MDQANLEVCVEYNLVLPTKVERCEKISRSEGAVLADNRTHTHGMRTNTIDVTHILVECPVRAELRTELSVEGSMRKVLFNDRIADKAFLMLITAQLLYEARGREV